jgi:hypothetical protein
MGKKVILASLALLLYVTGSAFAIGFHSIKLSRTRIETGQKFSIEVELDDPETNHQVEFYVDDYLLSKKNVGSSETIESSDWDWEVNELNCGPHTARAELKRGNVSVENVSVDFNVGRLPDASYDPEKPLVGKTLTITFTDNETGIPASGVKVDIYNTVSSKTEKRTTDGAGKITYSPENYGTYKMTLSGRDYCGKIDFNARHKLSFDGPYPENPVVGEIVSVAVPGSVGVKLLDEKGEVYLTAETKIAGGANFTVNKSGTYTLVIGDLSSRYWCVNKTLVVSDKDVPRITVTPDKSSVGEPVTITVESGGSPLDLAIVTVTSPDNSFDTYTTTSSGTVVYTPSVIGRYSVIVEKERFKTMDKSFESKNRLELDVYPRNPLVGDEVKISVKNQQGNPVGDVSITIDGTGDSTDSSGIYSKKFAKAGAYTITASKNPTLYWEASKNITVSGSLNLTLNSESVEIGDEIKMIVFDNSGAAVEAQITAVKPDGTRKTLEGSFYVPEEAGEHTLEAAKSGYESATKTITVLPRPITLDSSIEEDKLKLTLSSRGVVLPDVSLKLTSPYALESKTDSEGVAYIEIKGAGDYILEVNRENTKPLYESKTIQEKIVKKRKMLLLALPAIVIIASAALALYVIHRIKRGRSGKKAAAPEPESSKLFREKGGSKLSGV